jgi:CIC family chloride channel protein
MQAFRAHPVRRVMRRRWIWLEPEASLDEAERLMRLARLRQVPVVRDGILLGMVTYRQVLEASIARASAEPAAAPPPTSAGVMARAPATIAASESLADAAERMARADVGCLPVVEPTPAGSLLVGLVTEADLLRVAYDPSFAAERA